jgi:hypothetical protein
MVTCAMLAIALLLAVAVPFFAQFQALLGALTGVPTMLGWPMLFLLRGSAMAGRPLSMVDRGLCITSLCVLMPMLIVMGSASAIAGIADIWSSGAENPLKGCLQPRVT